MFSVAKALHIIFFTAWFAGLFYVVRLFIYNTEARARGGEAGSVLTEQFSLMQRRLWYGITWPAMVGTLLCGAWLGTLHGWNHPWLHLKLSLVGGLVGYHLFCGSIHRQLIAGRSVWSSSSLRLLNEVATLFLVSIVFLAVFRSSMTLDLALKVLGGLGAVLVLGFVGYRRVREARGASGD